MELLAAFYLGSACRLTFMRENWHVVSIEHTEHGGVQGEQDETPQTCAVCDIAHGVVITWGRAMMGQDAFR